MYDDEAASSSTQLKQLLQKKNNKFKITILNLFSFVCDLLVTKCGNKSSLLLQSLYFTIKNIGNINTNYTIFLHTHATFPHCSKTWSFCLNFTHKFFRVSGSSWIICVYGIKYVDAEIWEAIAYCEGVCDDSDQCKCWVVVVVGVGGG